MGEAPESTERGEVTRDDVLNAIAQATQLNAAVGA